MDPRFLLARLCVGWAGNPTLQRLCQSDALLRYWVMEAYLARCRSGLQWTASPKHEAAVDKALHRLAVGPERVAAACDIMTEMVKLQKGSRICLEVSNVHLKNLNDNSDGTLSFTASLVLCSLRPDLAAAGGAVHI